MYSVRCRSSIQTENSKFDRASRAAGQPLDILIVMIDPRKHDRSDRMGWGTKILIGLFALGALVMLALIGLGLMMPYLIDRAVERYTDSAPIAMDSKTLAPEVREEVEARIDAFRESIDAGESSGPLILTEEEINGLLAEEVDPRDGAVQLALEQNLVRAYVSLPIRAELPLGPWSRDLTGRYLNGVASVELGLAGGKLDYNIREFNVKGHPLPDYALDALEREVERTGAFDNQELRDYVRKARELRIEPGRIVLTPEGS